MVLLGIIVNSASLLSVFSGKFLSRIPEKTKETVMKGIG